MNKEVKFVKSNTSVFDALSIYSAHRNELTAEDKERLRKLCKMLDSSQWPLET